MTVAAVAIVRDEAPIIPRMIGSLAGFADAAVIVDTGSVDNTRDVVHETCDAHGINLTWTEQPWVDFGSNLTAAFAVARGTADWLMRADADMTVHADPTMTDWLANDATADGYNVTIRDHGTNYGLPLLVRGNQHWAYVGATHEYLDATGRTIADLYPQSLSVTHHADGTHRAIKHVRDIELLSTAVNDGDPRATYYTAAAHKYLGDLVTARELFRRRATMGGYAEEAWHAAYEAARITTELDGEPGITELLAVWRERPTRAEPLAAIESWCAANRPRTPPVGDRLFIETAAYDR